MSNSYATKQCQKEKKVIEEDKVNEYITTLINFAKYHLIMFVMAKIMEMTKEEQNQVALFLLNCIKPNIKK